MCDDKKEFVLSKQLLRSGTSVGAMVREAEHMKVKLTSFINLQLPKKKLMNQFIGLNY